MKSALVPLAVAVALGCGPRSRTTRSPLQEEDLAKALATIRGEDLAAHVRVLASDAFAGRFPGDDGETKTLAYLTRTFADLGIAPAVGGDYLQPVPLRRLRIDPTSTLAITGDDGTTTHVWGSDFLAWAHDDVTLDDRELVFVGYGITAPEYGWDDYAGADVRGKIVLSIGGEPAPTAAAPDRFEGDALTEHATPQRKIRAAAAAGAAAVLELRADGEHGIAWSVLETGARAPKLDLPPETGGTASARGMWRTDRAAPLLAAAGHDVAALASAAAEPGFVAIDLGLRASLHLGATHDEVVSHNVIGIIEGRERPDEYILHTAHWDHVGVREHLDGDRIFNGAVDNATGTAALLELAAAYAALRRPPRRSVVFVATTAEEQGLLGARHYVEHPVFALRDTIAVINMDALFPFGRTLGMTVVAMGASDLDTWFADAATHVGRVLVPDPMPQAGAFFRSDQYPFAERGVPAYFAVGGPAPDPAETVSLQRFVEYVTRRYHQPGDEYDEATWDMAGIVQDVEVYFRAGLALAEGDAYPNWRPDHPFRARRDAMRSREASAPVPVAGRPHRARRRVPSAACVGRSGSRECSRSAVVRR